jgi:hypothetical protein
VTRPASARNPRKRLVSEADALSLLLSQGPYSIKFSAADTKGESLFCVDMAFTITPPHVSEKASAQQGAPLLGTTAGAVLSGAVRRDALGELRDAFAAAAAAHKAVDVL